MTPIPERRADEGSWLDDVLVAVLWPPLAIATLLILGIRKLRSKRTRRITLE